MTNIIKNGRIIRTSRNLRGIVDYLRVSPAARIESCPISTGGTVRLVFKDGAECRAYFASYHVMIDWIRNRRALRGVKHIMQGPDMGYLTIPGVIAGTIKTVRDSHIREALDKLNTARELEYPDVGFTYYADIKGDGRNVRHVYIIINAAGGVSFSGMNGKTKRKTLDLISAAIKEV